MTDSPAPRLDLSPAEPHPSSSKTPVTLQEFVAASRDWSACPVPIPPPVTKALWCLAAADLTVVAGLASVEARGHPRPGPLTAAITLGGHEGATLLLAGASLVGLLLLSLITHGWTRAGALPLKAIAVVSLTSAVAVAGTFTVLAAVLAALALPLAALTGRR